MVIQDNRDRPKNYIDRALDILFKKKMTGVEFDIDILEIGGMRSELIHHVDLTSYGCCNDGHSSYLFARTGWKVVSVNINDDHVRIAQNACRLFDNIKFYCEDAMNTPERISGTIGLLYLDAWDLDIPESAEKHLAFWKALRMKIINSPLILIDDTDLYYDPIKKEYFPDKECLAGKGKLLIPELLKDDYKIEFNGRQTLLRQI